MGSKFKPKHAQYDHRNKLIEEINKAYTIQM